MITRDLERPDLYDNLSQQLASTPPRTQPTSRETATIETVDEEDALGMLGALEV